MSLEVKPLVRLDALRGLHLVLEKYDASAEELLSDFGFSPRLLSNPEASLPLDVLAEFGAFLDQRLGIPDLGLQLATRQSIQVLGPIALLVYHQSSLAEALKMIQRYLPYHTSGANLVLQEADNSGYIQLRYELQMDDQVPMRHAVEQSYLNLVNIIRLLLPDSLGNIEVEFRHEPAIPRARYDQFFACSIRFAANRDCLIFPSELLNQDLKGGSTYLSQMAEQQIAELIEERPLDTAWLVETLVERQLASGHCGIKQVAEQLKLNRRTLQRRLAKQHVSFEDILDEVRRKAANYHLSRQEHSLSQIAGLLGYSDQSAFTRACKRWTGTTPQVRRLNLQAGSDSTLST